MGIDRAFFFASHALCVRSKYVCVCIYMCVCVLVVSVQSSVDDQAEGEAERAKMQE